MLWIPTIMAASGIAVKVSPAATGAEPGGTVPPSSRYYQGAPNRLCCLKFRNMLTGHARCTQCNRCVQQHDATANRSDSLNMSSSLVMPSTASNAMTVTTPIIGCRNRSKGGSMRTNAQPNHTGQLKHSLAAY
jgi:hypothetical protein